MLFAGLHFLFQLQHCLIVYLKSVFTVGMLGIWLHRKAQDCLGAFTWIRFSVASMEEKSYDKIQRGKTEDLEKVKINLEEAVRIKTAAFYPLPIFLQRFVHKYCHSKTARFLYGPHRATHFLLHQYAS